MIEVLDGAAENSVIDSSKNVFADLNVQMSAEDMLKLEIAKAIASRITLRKLTQAQAAEIIGTDQAKISALLRGRLKGFSAERLIIFLMRLGLDVDVRLSSRNRQGRLKIFQAA